MASVLSAGSDICPSLEELCAHSALEGNLLLALFARPDPKWNALENLTADVRDER
jgi:hypothetical protein